MSQTLFCIALALISALYASVGQAGASGYIAAMALFGLAPDTIKPTALALNILVSAIVTYQFYRAGHFSFRLFLPFAVSSIPTALIGGYVSLPPIVFNRLLGALLLIAAVPLYFRKEPRETIQQPHMAFALLAGAVIGLLSGLTGVGGGILITPLLLHCGWANPKTAAAVSGVFILVNSVAAFAGYLGASTHLAAGLPFFALAVAIGAVIGSRLGSSHFSPKAIRRILGVILISAAAKLLTSS